MRILKTTFFLLLLAGCSSVTMCQNSPLDLKFRLAQSYERSGDYQSALPLYEEIYRMDSTSIVIFDALQRAYVQLKKYDDAISLIEKKVAQNPSDLNLWAILGTIYSRASNEPKAMESWERAIAIAPKSESTYRLVAGSMVESRLFERAVETYRRGREACGNPLLFANDLGYLYSVTLNFSEATREYLILLRQNPAQLGYVQSRIASYSGRKEGLAGATVAVEHVATTEPYSTPLFQLLAWLYMEGKNFDRAYDVYKNIDSKTNATGHELYNFAQLALREKAYPVSAKAFLDVETTYPAFNAMAQVKFGYARALEESAVETDTLHLFGRMNPLEKVYPQTEAQPTSTGVLAAYERVVREFPKTEVAAAALYRLAFIKFHRLLDLDGARADLETLVSNYSAQYAVQTEATLLLGDIYIALGNLDVAAKTYTVLASQPSARTEQKNTAALHLAEIDYFQGKFQDALGKLALLSNNPLSDITNDALDLRIFIQENMKPTDVPLKDFAAADLLKRQNKLSESLIRFQSILEAYPHSEIIDEALMEIGDVLAHLGRYTDAIASYEKLITGYPDGLVLDRAEMKIAEIYRWGLKDTAKTIETYKKLLELYPKSIYVSEARKRIRELRGDTI